MILGNGITKEEILGCDGCIKIYDKITCLAISLAKARYNVDSSGAITNIKIGWY